MSLNAGIIAGLEERDYAARIVPIDRLAVRGGLATYGRNNVTYVPGMGSFHRLSAFYSDLPADGNSWHELAMLDRPVPMAKKLEAHDLAGMLDLLPRNLAALFNLA